MKVQEEAMQSKANKREKKVYKSLYEVKDKYLPVPSLEFLEGKNNEFSRDTFMQILKKVARPVKKQVEKE